MRTLIASMCMTALLMGCSSKKPALFERVVDLSYAYDSTTVYWPTEQGFLLERGPAGMTPSGYYYSANRFWTPEHGGTHIDAPIHFHADRHTVDQIPVERLIGPGVVIDASKQCARNRDYEITIEDLQEWEMKHERIPEGAFVLLKTGFGTYWPDREQYMGTNERGPNAVAKLHFPGLHPDAARWLAEWRSIRAVGLDTPSIDHGQSTQYESHVVLFAKNIPALENVANLDQLPEKGFTVIALPMKITGGSGGPVRIVALW